MDVDPDSASPSSEVPELRIGDRQRRTVDDRLMAAVGDGMLTLGEYDERSGAVWQARTAAELQRVTADLPEHRSAEPVHSPTRETPARRVVAVLSQDRFDARLAPDQALHAYAFMGKAVVDLRREGLPAAVQLRVRAVMGEVEVLVPADASVTLRGMAVMGERKVAVAGGAGPRIQLDAVAVMGSVTVHHGDQGVAPARRETAPARRGCGRWREKLAGALVPVVLLGAAGAVVLAGSDGAAVFGSTEKRVLDAPRTTSEVHVSVLFGSVEVVIPDGAHADTSGFVVFGSVDCKLACDSVSPNGDVSPGQVVRVADTGQVVHVRGVGGFGSIEVKTASEAALSKTDN